MNEHYGATAFDSSFAHYPRFASMNRLAEIKQIASAHGVLLATSGAGECHLARIARVGDLRWSDVRWGDARRATAGTRALLRCSRGDDTCAICVALSIQQRAPM
jgi:hypothetical protein